MIMTLSGSVTCVPSVLSSSSCSISARLAPLTTTGVTLCVIQG